MKLYPLRPRVKNPRLWCPERPDQTTWHKIRDKMLARDDHTCRRAGFVAIGPKSTCRHII